MRLVLVVAMLVGSLAGDAHAMCAVAERQSQVTNVPLRGSLFVYQAPARRQIAIGVWKRAPVDVAITWKGVPGTTRETGISDTLVRVDYQGFAGSTLTINNIDYLLHPWLPSPNPPRVVEATHFVHLHECIGGDYVELVLDQPAAAYRVRWTHREKTVERIVLGDHWSWNGRHILTLGAPRCDRSNLEPAELWRGGELELFAIDPAGNELRLAGLDRDFTSAKVQQAPLNNVPDYAMRDELHDELAVEPLPVAAVRDLPPTRPPLPFLLLGLAALSYLWAARRSDAC